MRKLCAVALLTGFAHCPGLRTGRHMNRIAIFADRAAEAGFATVGIDYAGFGESEGQRGYIEARVSLTTLPF